MKKYLRLPAHQGLDADLLVATSTEALCVSCIILVLRVKDPSAVIRGILAQVWQFCIEQKSIGFCSLSILVFLGH